MLLTSNSESEREEEVYKNIIEQRILRELSTSNVNQQSLYIEFSNIDVAFELKYGVIHLLLVFHDLPSEDPH